MSAPIASLPNCINERILAEWVDVDTRQPCVLGSCSRFNKQATDFIVRADIANVSIHLSLAVTLWLGGRSRKTRLIMVVPSYCLITDVHSALTYSTLPAASPLVSPAVRDAVSNSGRVIHVCFRLAAAPIVAAPEIPSKTIKPTTIPAYDLLLGLQSLSRTRTFTISMRWNDYAFQGLRAFSNRLRIATNNFPRDFYLHGIYPGGEDGVEVDWNRLRYRHNPPPYDAEAAVKVQVAQSPPDDCNKDDALAINAADVTITETPIASPEPEVLHGIFSQSAAAEGGHTADSGKPLYNAHYDDEMFNAIPSDCGALSSNDYDDPLPHIEPCSDEERGAIVHACQTNVPFVPATTIRLRSDLAEWLQGAARTGCDIFKHQGIQSKLSALGYYARTCNTAAFDAVRPWCSAIVFLDPANELSKNDAARNVLSDMVQLIRWSNGLRRGAEMFAPLCDEFVRLGTAGRAVARMIVPGSKTEYERQRHVCVAHVLVAFGTLQARGEMPPHRLPRPATCS